MLGSCSAAHVLYFLSFRRRTKNGDHIPTKLQSIIPRIEPPVVVQRLRHITVRKPKLQSYLCAVVAVTQLRFHRAAADWCEEFTQRARRCPSPRVYRPIAKVSDDETPQAPPDIVSCLTKRSPWSLRAWRDVVRKHDEKLENLPEGLEFEKYQNRCRRIYEKNVRSSILHACSQRQVTGYLGCHQQGLGKTTSLSLR